MNCLLCKATCCPYFTKDFHGDCTLGVCQYDKCPNCGSVFCSTMCELPDAPWRGMQDALLKDKAIGTFHPRDYGWYPRIVKQAEAIAELYRQKWIPNDGIILDWGAGTGMLSQECAKVGVTLECYDPYYHKDGWHKSVAAYSCAFVSCSAVLEHLRTHGDVDAVFAAPRCTDGVLMLHTSIVDVVPQDQTWYYLLPGHCSLWTAKAIRLYTNRHGYMQYLYHGPSATWFFAHHQQRFYPSTGAWQVRSV